MKKWVYKKVFFCFLKNKSGDLQSNPIPIIVILNPNTKYDFLINNMANFKVQQIATEYRRPFLNVLQKCFQEKYCKKNFMHKILKGRIFHQLS